jgi:hypothetical protein
MNFSVIPDITMQGLATEGARTLTIGTLAALVRDVAVRPAYWWHLARFDGSSVAVAAAHPLWLTAWPPGHRAGTGATVLAVVAGELSERTITGQGVAERTIRANRVRVYGAGDPRELANPGPGYALSLHATTG